MKPIILAVALAAAASPLPAQTIFVDQGPDWNRSARAAFYVQDQGSRIMPIAWMRALTAPDGSAFLADALARYGYLPNPGAVEADLPVGFTTNGTGADQAVGMTCAACHTREISVNGAKFRIDGGPAIVDFETFLVDLNAAVLAVLADDTAFAAFADKVLGSEAGDPARQALKAEVDIWSNRFGTLIERSLPQPGLWGPARLDAVSMIFNRLTGLDLGAEDQDYLIPDNINAADAPTRYPFLWNASRQDFTQWPGFAENGNDLLALARNLGEVYGVFGTFHPTDQSGWVLLNRDYIGDNSANFDGLGKLETAISTIGPPVWPWGIDEGLAAQGEQVFNLPTDQGGCVACHGKKNGAYRFTLEPTLATPILPAGTDTRECNILTRTAQTGVLEGASIPVLLPALGAEDTAFNLLAISVIGAILQHAGSLLSDSDRAIVMAADAETLTAADASPQIEGLMRTIEDLRGAFPITDEARGMLMENAGSGCKYEARVLDGIWAAAPYLHNGSVPTLADLLKVPDQRPQSFQPGPNYDIETVGMAAEQQMFGQTTITTTGCDQIDSGNSRCGHDWGTALSDQQKRELLEYLKSI
ncbi:MAG: di-heme-cytochrome C peroxidase [Paracoccus sp. (in: a-proteobacteria)]